MNDKVIIFLSGVAVGMLVCIPVTHRCVDEVKRRNEESLERFADDIHKDITSFLHTENEMTTSAEKSDMNENADADCPHIITPEEFGEIEDYDTISLTLYSDGVVADDADKPIEDVDEVIGKESLDHFGEYEDDSVFVRNDKLKCDYEVLIDERQYAQILEEKPYLKE